MLRNNTVNKNYAD